MERGSGHGTSTLTQDPPVGDSTSDTKRVTSDWSADNRTKRSGLKSVSTILDLEDACRMVYFPASPPDSSHSLSGSSEAS